MRIVLTHKYASILNIDIIIIYNIPILEGVSSKTFVNIIFYYLELQIKLLHKMMSKIKIFPEKLLIVKFIYDKTKGLKLLLIKLLLVI